MKGCLLVDKPGSWGQRGAGGSIGSRSGDASKEVLLCVTSDTLGSGVSFEVATECVDSRFPVC